MRVLVLGITGMLGSAMLRVLSAALGLDVWGTARAAAKPEWIPSSVRDQVISGIDVLCPDDLITVLGQVRPDVIINCVGLVKQLPAAKDPLQALPLNAMFPHRLARLASLIGARVVHISTDCVFTGDRGGYRENDVPDALDLYGQSKALGELRDYPGAITLRTSIIGHEQGTSHALVEWFLSQEKRVYGYTRALFNGLPTVELAALIRDHILPQPNLSGLYHVSSEPIDKYTLLRLVAAAYGKTIEIVPDDAVVVDHTLDSTLFSEATGYRAPAWPELVRRMHENR